MVNGHKKKKPTKAELIASIPQVVNKELKDNFTKNMAQGGQLAQQMILDYIKTGKNLDEVVSFIEMNLSQNGKDAMDRVTQSKTVANEESN